MKIAIIGYGKMGKEIEKIAKERNHTISEIIDNNDSCRINKNLSSLTDVAIEFTNPDSAKNNIYKCIENKIPVVSGTTGWNINIEEIKKLCSQYDSSMFYSSNFSIGMNIFFEVNEYLSKLISKFDDYSASIEETHHIHKLDKPSGTAISLASGIINNNNRYKNMDADSNAHNNLTIKSFREGEVIGDHKITWENDIDKITIEHSAKNRSGFAIGAVLASEYIFNKKGFYTMKSLLNL